MPLTIWVSRTQTGKWPSLKHPWQALIEETQPQQPWFSAQRCRLKISKFNRKSNRRLRLNWQCIRLRLHFISFLVNSIDYDYSKNCNRLWSITITPCLITSQYFIYILLTFQGIVSKEMFQDSAILCLPRIQNRLPLDFHMHFLSVLHFYVCESGLSKSFITF